MSDQNKNTILKWIKQLFSKGNEDDQSNKRLSPQYVLILLSIGVLLMVFGNFFRTTPSGNESEAVISAFNESNQEDAPAFGGKNDGEPTTITEYEDRYENQLREALQDVSGISDVTIVVNVDATEEKVLQKNIITQSQTTDETDREGGKREVKDKSLEEQTVVVRKGDQESPIVVKTEKPEVTGVLVVAAGAENIQVKKWIVEAVTRSLDVPPHRVSVLPKKTKGDE